MASVDFSSEEFGQALVEAGREARRQAFAAGFPVVFMDDQGRYVQEFPDGRCFEIRFIPGAPRDSHMEIVRELTTSAK